MSRLPRRIVCLTTETVEVLYALGEEALIVGISGYTVRPARARKEKPKVFAFISGDIEKILAVNPDLVLTFSNLQADIARRADPRRGRRPCLQPAQHRGHPGDDRDRQPPGRRRGKGAGPGLQTGADQENPART